MARALIAAASLAALITAHPVGQSVKAREEVGVETPPSSKRSGEIVDVRTADALAPDLIRAVAEIGAPDEITLRGPQTVHRLIEERCGLVTPTYVEVFVKRNEAMGRSVSPADLTIAGADRTFTFPSCIRPASVRREVVSSVDQLFKSLKLRVDAAALEKAPGADIIARGLETLRFFGKLGAGSDKGFVSTELARKFVRDNPGIAPGDMQRGQTVLLPTIETVATIQLDKGVTAADAQARLAALLTRSSAMQVQVAELISDEALLPKECEGAVAGSWPFPAGELRKALIELVALRPAGRSGRSEVKVMTIDTGYDTRMGPPAIEADLLGYLRGSDEFAMSNLVGLSAVDPLSTDAVPPDDLASRQHGGEVAATLLGGSYLVREPAVLVPPRLAFVSIAARGPNGASYLDVGGIGEAMAIAQRNEVTIVNASVSTLARRQAFLDLIAGDTSRLLVVAAGNSRSNQEFQEDDMPWPGSMGGSSGNAAGGTVISVGAHDPSGAIVPFSRYGRRVDILAPGCRIPTYSLEGDKVVKVERNGTSFAAPLVTLVAAQLARAGLSAVQIKERLIISANVDERVANLSYSQGRLDAVRALSLWRDVAEYDERQPDGSVVRKRVSGILDSRFASIQICGQSLTQMKLRRLSFSTKPGDASGIPKWRAWYRGAGSLEKIDPCDATPDAVKGVDLRIKTEGGPVDIPVGSIRSFTARYAS